MAKHLDKQKSSNSFLYKDKSDQKKQEQKQQQIPKEKAEQMLKALENDEKDLQNILRAK